MWNLANRFFHDLVHFIQITFLVFFSSCNNSLFSFLDILCIVKDVVDPDIDTRLASFVVQSHIRSHPNYQEGDLEGVNLNAPPTEGVHYYLLSSSSNTLIPLRVCFRFCNCCSLSFSLLAN
jgi:hypothetical protein